MSISIQIILGIVCGLCAGLIIYFFVKEKGR